MDMKRKVAFTIMCLIAIMAVRWLIHKMEISDVVLVQTGFAYKKCEELRVALQAVSYHRSGPWGVMCYVVSFSTTKTNLSQYAMLKDTLKAATLMPPDLKVRTDAVSTWILDMFSTIPYNQGFLLAVASMHDWGDVSPQAHQILRKLNVPFLSFCALKTDALSILIPDSEFLETKGYREMWDGLGRKSEISWDRKTDRAFFRGSSTGGRIVTGKYLNVPRVRLAHLSNSLDLKNKLDAGISNLCQVEPQDRHAAILAEMTAMNIIKKTASLDEAIQNKILIDIDGNTNSWAGSFWKLASSSLTLKIESKYKQWWYPQLIEWVHYVPVDSVFSDLSQRIDWALDPQNVIEVHEMIRASTCLMRGITYEHTIREFADIFRAFIREY